MKTCQSTRKHLDMVRFYLGERGYVWICIECGEQITGLRKIEEAEINDLIQFLKESRDALAKRVGDANKNKGDKK